METKPVFGFSQVAGSSLSRTQKKARQVEIRERSRNRFGEAEEAFTQIHEILLREDSL